MKIAITNTIGIDRNKTTLACPELAEERSVRWPFSGETGLCRKRPFSLSLEKVYSELHDLYI